MVVSCDKLIGVIPLDMSSMHVSFLLSRFVKTSESRFGPRSPDSVERTSRMGAHDRHVIISVYWSSVDILVLLE